MDFLQHLAIALTAETTVKTVFEVFDLIGKNLKGNQGFIRLFGGEKGIWDSQRPEEFELMIRHANRGNFEKA